MNKLKYISFIILVILTVNKGLAQVEDDEKLDKFKAHKVAFISDKVKLTSKEAEVFWPVYNEFDKKRQELNVDKLKTMRLYLATASTMSEKEASEMADKLVSIQKKEALLAEEYNVKFKSILPASKVLKLYQAEIQFKRQLLKSLKQ